MRIVIIDDSGLRATVLEEGLREAGYVDEARTALSDRKIIDRAKSILMSQRGLSEPDAYALLRSSAMNQGKKIVDVAQALITASDLLGGM